MTGDHALLRAHRTRWLQLDEEEPLGGAAATCPDPILVKGDWRIDFLPPTQHTFGQSFTAGAAWQHLNLKLSNTGKSPAELRGP